MVKMPKILFFKFFFSRFLDIKSIMALRNAKGLDRFVYISCSPKSAVKNWVDLARPCSKSYRGNPFRATAAIGVDMFPQTHHSEMVLLFERVQDEIVEEAATAVELIETTAAENVCNKDEGPPNKMVRPNDKP